MQWIVKQLLDECPELESFIQNHSKLFEQPIMQHFLSSPQARNVFLQSIREPTDANQQRLDDHSNRFILMHNLPIMFPRHFTGLPFNTIKNAENNELGIHSSWTTHWSQIIRSLLNLTTQSYAKHSTFNHGLPIQDSVTP